MIYQDDEYKSFSTSNISTIVAPVYIVGKSFYKIGIMVGIGNRILELVWRVCEVTTSIYYNSIGRIKWRIMTVWPINLIGMPVILNYKSTTTYSYMENTRKYNANCPKKSMALKMFVKIFLKAWKKSGFDDFSFI